MGAYNLTVTIRKNGVDEDTVVLALDDSTDIGRSARITATQNGSQVGLRLDSDVTDVVVDISTNAEFRDQ